MRALTAAAVLAAWALGADPTGGQELPGRLAFEREFFVYPASGWRNPFRSPAGLPVAGLALLGVVRAEDPERSVALLAATGAHAGGATSVGCRRTIRLRTGDHAGNVRIVEVDVARVVVAVQEPGERERLVELALPRRRSRGTERTGS